MRISSVEKSVDAPGGRARFGVSAVCKDRNVLAPAGGNMGIPAHVREQDRCLFRRTRMLPIFIALVFGLQSAALGADRVPIEFAYEWDVGFGTSVYLVGNHPDLGAWNPIHSQRLVWTPGNIWRGTVGLPAGTALEYKFIARENSRTNHCNGANVEWIDGPNLVTNVPPMAPLPYSGKTIYYYSEWTNAFILHRVGTNFVNVAMERVDEGRTPSESLFRVQDIGVAGGWIEFVPNGYVAGQQQWDNAPYPGFGNNNYATELDQFFLQDGQIFNYQPPTSVSPPRMEEMQVGSTVQGMSDRRVRVWLPRGYDENEWKRYPVVYMHDGQNVFEQGFVPGLPPNSWRVDESTERETSQGRMRELIIVAIDNGPNRLPDYCPPGDTVFGDSGIAHLYAHYVEENVRPAISNAYRVLTDRANTAVMGSSMGGLVSAYMGLEASESYGAIGALSPSFWTAPNFVQRIGEIDKQDVRIYSDGGTGEADSIWDLWAVHDHLLRNEYVLLDELQTVIECGAGHNEIAWQQRFPDVIRFLLPLDEEANALVHDQHPVELLEITRVPELFSLTFPAFRGWTYVLEHAHSLVDPTWNPVLTNQQAASWGMPSALLPAMEGEGTFRVRALASPQN